MALSGGDLNFCVHNNLPHEEVGCMCVWGWGGWGGGGSGGREQQRCRSGKKQVGRVRERERHRETEKEREVGTEDVQTTQRWGQRMYKQCRECVYKQGRENKLKCQPDLQTKSDRSTD